MENPRPEKVAIVDEVKSRFNDAEAALLTEYRGLDVGAISELRRALSAAGGDYKVYKNTLVGFAARDLGLALDDMLTGPTAIAFVTTKPDGTPGDAVTVAKVLRDFGRTNPNLVVKGGLLGDALLSADEAKALADVAPREELLARLAGGLAAPMVKFAGLLQALPRNFAYGLSALIEMGGAPGAPAAPEAEPEAAAPEAEATPAEAEAPAADAEATTAEAPAADADAPAEAPAADAEETPAEAAEAETTDSAPATEAAADDTAAGDTSDDNNEES